jgi:hypothetical protein
MSEIRSEVPRRRSLYISTSTLADSFEQIGSRQEPQTQVAIRCSRASTACAM